MFLLPQMTTNIDIHFLTINREYVIFTHCIHSSSNVDLLKYGLKIQSKRTDIVKEQKQEGEFQMKIYI